MASPTEIGFAVADVFDGAVVEGETVDADTVPSPGMDAHNEEVDVASNLVIRAEEDVAVADWPPTCRSWT